MRATVPAEPPRPQLEIDVQLATGETLVPAGADFEAWVGAAMLAAGSRRDGELAIRLVGTDEGTELNRNWRDKPGPTNVLAFPPPDLATAGLPEGLPAEFGDLVICLPVVVREAAEQQKAPLAHLAHLVVHGTLHLLGHTHDGEADTARMEGLESAVLAGLGFPDPWAADAGPGTK
ncbi:MAG: rRNA maturation RNase YbeY [Gammaproteobacteria bacterium]|jgi:probable rRNA maturation factor|nr:rRNA maturation RNase YbeY [Gammaproteobacteria bacterium]